MKKAQNEPMEGVQWEGGTGEKKNAKTNTNTHATKKNERKKIKITEEPKPGLGAAKPSRAERGPWKSFCDRICVGYERGVEGGGGPPSRAN